MNRVEHLDNTERKRKTRMERYFQERLPLPRKSCIKHLLRMYTVTEPFHMNNVRVETTTTEMLFG